MWTALLLMNAAGFGIMLLDKQLARHHRRRVPEAMLTEGVTWVMTGIGIGMALGAFVAGWVVDRYDADSGFWVSVTAGAIAFLTVLSGQRVLGGAGEKKSAENLATTAAE